jgi:hypothetical protein
MGSGRRRFVKAYLAVLSANVEAGAAAHVTNSFLIWSAGLTTLVV